MGSALIVETVFFGAFRIKTTLHYSREILTLPITAGLLGVAHRQTSSLGASRLTDLLKSNGVITMVVIPHFHTLSHRLISDEHISLACWRRRIVTHDSCAGVRAFRILYRIRGHHGAHVLKMAIR